MLNRVEAIIDTVVDTVVGTLFDSVITVVAALFLGYQHAPEKKKYDVRDDALHRWRRRQERKR